MLTVEKQCSFLPSRITTIWQYFNSDSTQFYSDSDNILRLIGYPTIVSSLEGDWLDIDEKFR